MASANLASVLLSTLAPQGDGKTMGATGGAAGADTGLFGAGAAASSFAALLGLAANDAACPAVGDAAPLAQDAAQADPSDNSLAQSLAALMAGIVSPIQGEVQPPTTPETQASTGDSLTPAVPGAGLKVDPSLIAAGQADITVPTEALASPSATETQVSPALVQPGARATPSDLADALLEKAPLPAPQAIASTSKDTALSAGRPPVDTLVQDAELPLASSQAAELAATAPTDANLEAQADPRQVAPAPVAQPTAPLAQATPPAGRKPGEAVAKTSQARGPSLDRLDDSAPTATPARSAPAGSVATLSETAVSATDAAAKDDAQPAIANATADGTSTGLAVASAQAAPSPTTVAADTPKVTAHTVAHLAAQIVNNVEGKATRFDVTLSPEGLGKVDVRVQIGVGGDITAQLNFANADAAAQMQSRAQDLHAALEQAGFDPSRTALSFNSGGAQQGPWQDAQSQQQYTPAWSGRAFSNLAEPADEMPMAYAARASSGGVDVRI